MMSGNASEVLSITYNNPILARHPSTIIWTLLFDGSTVIYQIMNVTLHISGRIGFRNFTETQSSWISTKWIATSFTYEGSLLVGSKESTDIALVFSYDNELRLIGERTLIKGSQYSRINCTYPPMSDTQVTLQYTDSYRSVEDRFW